MSGRRPSYYSSCRVNLYLQTKTSNYKDVMRICVQHNVVKFFNLSCYFVIRNLGAQRGVIFTII